MVLDDGGETVGFAFYRRFVRGATEAINLVAQSYARPRLRPGDEILITHMEHHSNIVPWQQLAAQVGAKIKVIPVDDTGQLRLDEYQKLLNDRTKGDVKGLTTGASMWLSGAIGLACGLGLWPLALLATLAASAASRAAWALRTRSPVWSRMRARPMFSRMAMNSISGVMMPWRA